VHVEAQEQDLGSFTNVKFRRRKQLSAA
jgi:hypothetical protein